MVERKLRIFKLILGIKKNLILDLRVRVLVVDEVDVGQAQFGEELFLQRHVVVINLGGFNRVGVLHETLLEHVEKFEIVSVFCRVGFHRCDEGRVAGAEGLQGAVCICGASRRDCACKRRGEATSIGSAGAVKALDKCAVGASERSGVATGANGKAGKPSCGKR